MGSDSHSPIVQVRTAGTPDGSTYELTYDPASERLQGV